MIKVAVFEELEVADVDETAFEVPQGEGYEFTMDAGGGYAAGSRAGSGGGGGVRLPFGMESLIQKPA